MRGLGGRYAYDEKSGELIYKKPVLKDGCITGEQEVSVANHTPLVKERRIIDDGITTHEEVVCQVCRAGQVGEPVSISLRDYQGQTPTQRFGAACYLSPELRSAKEHYRTAIGAQAENAPCTTIYQHTGWRKINGEWVFLNGGHSVAKDGLTRDFSVELDNQLEPYGFVGGQDEERFKTLLDLLPKVAPPALVYAGLGLCFLTPLNGLLREKGFEPRFILYLTGKTGTRKTTLAKLFLNFFGRFDNGTPAPASFMDTANAVERKFALADSVVMLLDDRIPSSTPSVKAQMEKMEQSVARMIGDRAARARMEMDGSLRKACRPKCGLIVTAEEAFVNIGESAVARSISVELKPGDVNLEALTEAQEKAGHLNQIMGEYLGYILSHFEDLSNCLPKVFTGYRAKAQTGGHGRLAEAVAHLQLGIFCMCEWLKSAGQIDERRAHSMLGESWKLFLELAGEQRERMTEEQPTKIFLDTLREMLNRDTYLIRRVDQANMASTGKILGYRDTLFYYLYPEAVYAAIAKQLEAQGQVFPLSRNTLFKALHNEGLIEPDKKQLTKVKRLGGKCCRFLWLRASALEEKEDEAG